ncbi:MAG: hypothetical protein AAF570_08390 [Bacteroidota bacterium]
MQVSGQLHELIQSLSQAEKRYFKVFAGRHTRSRDNKSVRLFDVIAGQVKYDEAAVRKKFKGEAFVKHLSAEKVYLYRLIMRSLRAFHAGKTVDRQLRDMLFDARILADKGLHHQSARILGKARALGHREERFLLLLEILEFEREILKETPPRDAATALDDNMQARIDTLEAIQNVQEYTFLYDRLFLTVRSEFNLRNPKDEDAFARLMASPLLHHDAQPATFRARLYYHMSYALHFQLNRVFDQANHHYAKVVEAWEAHPGAIADAPARYLKSLGNFLASCHMTDRFEHFPETLAKLQEVPIHHPHTALVRFRNGFFYQLLYALSTGEFDQALAVVPQITEGLERFGHLLNHSRRLGFHYNLTILYFFVGDHKAALRWLRPILDLPRTEQRRDIQQFARILQLILHYELQNHSLLDYLFRSTYRFLHRRNRLHPFEQAILRFMRTIAGYPPGQDLRPDMRRLLDAFAPLHAAGDDGMRIGLQELTCWLQSKVEDLPMQAAARRLLRADTSPP